MKISILFYLLISTFSVFGQYEIIHDPLSVNIEFFSMYNSIKQQNYNFSSQNFDELELIFKNRKRYVFKIEEIKQDLIDYATLYLVENPSGKYFLDSLLIIKTTTHLNKKNNYYVIAVNNKNHKIYYLSGKIFTSSLTFSKDNFSKESLANFLYYAYFHLELSNIKVKKKINGNYCVLAFSNILNKKVKIKVEYIKTLDVFQYKLVE